MKTLQFIPDDPGVGPTEAKRREHALDIADWLEAGRDEARTTGNVEALRRPVIQNVDLVVEALREFGNKGRQPVINGPNWNDAHVVRDGAFQSDFIVEAFGEPGLKRGPRIIYVIATIVVIFGFGLLWAFG